MTLLLDTHTLLWAVLSPKALSKAVARIIANKENDLLVSAASAWEIATKVRLGKLSGAEHFEQTFVSTLHSAGYQLLPITAEDALRAGRMAGQHRDPFDRMLAAQAVARDIPILSNDERLDSFGVRRLWR